MSSRSIPSNNTARLLPDAKVITTILGADAALIISYFTKLPPEIAIAIVTVAAGVIGYFTPRRTNIDHQTDLSGL
jgi:hypothetical protein